MRFLAYDGPLFRFLDKAVDCILISLLWFVASLPVVTGGAATVALYHTVNKVVREEEGTIWKTFWRAFGRDFWQATGIWVIFVVFYGASLMTFLIIYNAKLNVGLMLPLLVALILVTLWTQYWYPYLSRFEDKTKALLKNTLVMLFVDFLRSIKLLLMLVICVVLLGVGLIYAPIIIPFLPAVYVLMANRTVDKVFGRYIDTETETATEQEFE